MMIVQQDCVNRMVFDPFVGRPTTTEQDPSIREIECVAESVYAKIWSQSTPCSRCCRADGIRQPGIDVPG